MDRTVNAASHQPAATGTDLVTDSIVDLFASCRAAARPVRVYVSGPMRGIMDFNFPSFKSTTAYLREHGYEVMCPTEITPNQDTDWHTCLRADIKALCDVDLIVLLPGFENSVGANLELHVAHRLGITAISLRDLGDLHRDGYRPPAAPVAPPPQAATSAANDETTVWRTIAAKSAWAECSEIISLVDRHIEAQRCSYRGADFAYPLQRLRVDIMARHVQQETA